MLLDASDYRAHLIPEIAKKNTNTQMCSHFSYISNLFFCIPSLYLILFIPKAPQILEAGASLGLGCDGAAPSNLDIFDEMKVLRYAMMAYWGLPSFNPVVMTCPTLLKMASQGGANALGHGDILGSVEEGKKADLILLNIDQPHITPSQNLVNTIVDAANGHDVTDSIINGKIVMKNREVLTLDEERIRFEAEKHMNDIIKRAY